MLDTFAYIAAATSFCNNQYDDDEVVCNFFTRSIVVFLHNLFFISAGSHHTGERLSDIHWYMEKVHVQECLVRVGISVRWTGLTNSQPQGQVIHNRPLIWLFDQKMFCSPLYSKIMQSHIILKDSRGFSLTKRVMKELSLRMSINSETKESWVLTLGAVIIEILILEWLIRANITITSRRGEKFWRRVVLVVLQTFFPLLLVMVIIITYLVIWISSSLGLLSSDDVDLVWFSLMVWMGTKTLYHSHRQTAAS